MEQVLITGATGFIGCNMVAQLLAENLEVVAWVRKKPSNPLFDSQGVEFRIGSLNEAAAHIRKTEGITAVIHLAAVVSPYSRAKTFETNVDGTRSLAKECSRRVNPPKFIYVSSLSASGPSVNGQPRLESDECWPRSLYGDSKYSAEQGLRSLANDLPISIVRPPAVFGAWDRNLLQMFQMVRRKWNLIGISKRLRYSFVHAEDLTRGILSVVQRGQRLTNEKTDSSEDIGKGIYFLTDPRPVTFEELGNMIAESLGVSRPWSIVMPGALCWSLAGLSDFGGRYFNIPTFLNLDKMREASAGSWICDSSKAAREIGFEVQANLQQRIEQTSSWYREHGWL